MPNILTIRRVVLANSATAANEFTPPAGSSSEVIVTEDSVDAWLTEDGADSMLTEG